MLTLLFLDLYTGDAYDSRSEPLWLKLVIPLITITGSLAIAYLVYNWNKKNTNNTREKEKYESDLQLLHYILDSLSGNIIAARVQKEEVDNFISSIREITDNIHLAKESSLMFDWLDSIDKPRFRKLFYKYYKEEHILEGITVHTFEKKNDFYTLMSRVNHLIENNNHLHSYYHDFIRLRNIDQLEFRKNLNNLEMKIQEHHTNFKNPTEFQKRFKEILDQYNNTDPKDKELLKFIYPKLLKPLEELVNSITTSTFNPELSLTIQSYMDVKRHFDTAVEYFQVYSNNFEVSTMYIEKILDHLIEYTPAE